MPGRSKSFNELFKQYRDEKSSSTTGEPIEINNQSLTNEIFVEQQSENFAGITNEPITPAPPPLSLVNSYSDNIIKATKQIPLVRSTSTTPNKKESENDTSNVVDLNFKTTPIINQINNNHKYESNHLIDAQFNNDTFKYNSSNDFINVKYETKTNSQIQSIGEVMPNGDIDYRSINQPSFQFSSNNHLNNNSGFNMIQEENINFHYQQTNNAHLSIHQNQHNTTYEALNNSNDLVYLSSPPPSNSINPNKFHQQKQTLLTTSPPPTTPNSMTESYYFDSILSKLNLTNNIVKHHPRPSAVTSFNARLTNNGGGYTLWNRRQDNLRHLLCNAFESAASPHCSKNRNYGFNQAPLPNNIANATWVSPTSSLNLNRANSNYTEYAATSSHNNKTFNNEITNNFRPKNMNSDSDKNQYSLSSLINKKNSFNTSNTNHNNHNNHEVSGLKNREIQISNTNHQHHYQHQNNNHFTNSTNIQNDFLTNAIKKAAASNLNSNTIVPSANLQSISSSSFSNSSHSWVIKNILAQGNFALNKILLIAFKSSNILIINKRECIFYKI